MINRHGESHALPVYKCGKGQPILLVHGIISDAGFFNGLCRLLSVEKRVICYDRRGYGMDTNDWGGDFSLSSQAGDAAEIIKKEIGAPTWVYGHSAGGLIAIELALRYPELVKGLVLLEPALALEAASKAALAEWNNELNGYVAEKRIKRALPAFSRAVGQSNAELSGVTMEEMKRTYANLTNFMYGELNCVQRYYPDLERLRSINCPVYVLVTEKGVDTVFGASSIAGARILGWELSFIPGGHNSVKTCPRATAEYIAEVTKSYSRE